MPRRIERVTETVTHIISEYILRIQKPGEIITITRSDLTPDLRRLVCGVSVLPPDRENEALQELEGSAGEIRAVLATKTKMAFVPTIHFEIDRGEKLRQRIDELLKK